MGSSHDFSRRKFLSAAVTSTAASLLVRPALSFGLDSPALASPHPAPFETNAAAGSTSAWQDQGVLNLSSSPYAKLHTVPVRAVTIEEGFWSKRRTTNVESSIPTMRDGTRRAWAHGQFPPACWEKLGAAKRPYLFRLRHLQVDGSRGLGAAIRRSA